MYIIHIHFILHLLFIHSYIHLDGIIIYELRQGLLVFNEKDDEHLAGDYNHDWYKNSIQQSC